MFKNINYGIKCDESRNFKGNQIIITHINCVSEYRKSGKGFIFSFSELRYQIHGAVNGEHFITSYTIDDDKAYVTEQELTDAVKTGIKTVINKFHNDMTVIKTIDETMK